MDELATLFVDPQSAAGFFDLLPPGPLRYVADSPRAVAEETATGGRHVDLMPLDRFLSAEGVDETRISPCAAILFDLNRPVPDPLALLHRAASSLVDHGVFLFRWPDAMPPRAVGAKRNPEDYFSMLAVHYGFLPVEAPGTGFRALRKTGKPRWRIALPDPDPTECRTLFSRVFGAEITPEFWQWKYGEGRGRAVVARRGRQLIAHYGGTARRVLFNGQETRALQVCDVMVAPEERAVMTRSGAFFQVASAWLETHFGYFNEHRLAFGFPNRRAMRLGERLGLYSEVARITELNWLPLSQRPGITTTARLLDPLEDVTALMAQLWEQMRNDLGGRIAVIRDPEYLRYRYLEHPQYRYDLVAIVHRFTRRPCALVVLRREAEFCRLLDYVGPLREIPRAMAHVRRLVGACGLPRLTGWITARDADLFVAAGAEATPTDVCVPINAWSESPSPEEVRDRWWLMMGDTEFL